MKKYKICVYAICKNEEQFVQRWYNSVSEADKIIVLDTGSIDNTVEKLKELGVEVHVQEFNPWRFDEARNASLDLIPQDYNICFCTDLDEIIMPGWKEKILENWHDDVTRLRYTYNWSFDEYGKPATTFMINKIHARNGYKWTHPVHEVLTPLIKEKEILVKDIVVNHYPDPFKSRSSYLPLLELSVKEDPEDDRNMHYLGREYMYYQKWDECIKTLKKHLNLRKATWKPERAASMRFIARSYNAKKDRLQAEEWYKNAIAEAPYLREGYIELAYLYYEEANYQKAYDYLNKALEIKEKSNTYINEQFAWNSFPYDLLSICAYNLNKYEEALDYVKTAISMDKNNLRLQMNLDQIENKVKQIKDEDNKE